MTTALRDVRRRVKSYVRAHENNPYQASLILGFVGMNGHPLLRLDDIKALLEATEPERNTTP